MFQVYVLLSHFSKGELSFGGNISLDLALEFLNGIFEDAVNKHADAQKW